MGVKDLLSIWGAVTGTLGLSWNMFLHWRKGRPRVVLSVSKMNFVDHQYQQAPGGLQISVVNRSEYPVTVIGLAFQKPGESFFSMPEVWVDRFKTGEIKPHSADKLFVPHNEAEILGFENGRFRFVVHLATGENIPTKWIDPGRSSAAVSNKPLKPDVKTS